MESFAVVVVLIAFVAFVAYKIANRDKSGGGSYRDGNKNQPR